ncbi:DsrC family protein [hydrothermal vent metagenome]|uniref:DsrC family protein n=1 Tax=hydrothermal vent metagenome TaxID=652676 RepID=A0A3B1AJ12_9ZZZZ
MQAEIDGQVIELSEAGWLLNLDEWSVGLAVEISKTEKIQEMTDEHWDIVNLAREYFTTNGSVAEPRVFSKLLKEKFGKDRSSQKYIYTLFPTGLIKCANKVAGLPRPKGCS